MGGFYHKFQISNNHIVKWQKRLTTIANLFKVPFTVIVQQQNNKFNVIATNQTSQNLIKKSNTSNFLDNSFYNEAIKHTNGLLIKDIAKENKWKNKFFLGGEFISCYTYPIHWPNGEIFGLIGIFGNNSKEYNTTLKEIFAQYKESFEDDLKFFITQKDQKENEAVKQNSSHSVIQDELGIDYRQIVEHQKAMVIKFNLKNEIIYANKSYCTLFGENLEKVLGKPFVTIDNRSKFKNIVLELNKTPFESQHEEFTGTSKGKRWIKWSSNAIVGLDGSINEIISVGHDITEQRSGNEALKKNETEFRKVIELNPIPMVVTDRNSDIIMLNKAFTNTFGYIQSEIPTGKDWWLTGYPDPEYRKTVQKEWNKAIEEAMRKGADIKPQIWQPTCKNGIKKIVVFSFMSLGEQNVILMQDITEQKVAELALIENEAKSRALSDATVEALFFSDEGICIECNKAAIEMFGYSYDELIGIFGTDIIANESKKLVENNMLTGCEEPYEALGQKKDGTKFWVEINGRMYSYKNKKVRVAAIRDISKRKIAEGSLKYSEEKFRAAFMISPDSININRLSDSLFMEINQGFTQLTGYTEKDVAGKTTLEMNIWHDLMDREKLLTELHESGQCTNLEAKFRTKDGGIIVGLMSASIVSIQNELCIISITRNIQGLKATENELIKAKEAAEGSEKNYQDLFNKMIDGVAVHKVIYDKSGEPVDYKFIEINPAYEKLTGLKRVEIINKTVREVLPNTEKHWIDDFGKVGKTGEPLRFEDYAEELDRFFNGIAYSPKKDYFAVIFSDVTDEKKAERILLENDERLKEQNDQYQELNEKLKKVNQELLLAKEKAIESDNLKTAFLANMSHEIRTPMNGIMGFSGLLAKNNLTVEKKKKYVNILHHNSAQLLSIINDLVDISKIEAGQIELEESEVKLNTLTQNLSDLYFQKAVNKNIELELVNFNTDLVIITDETKVKQVLTNLLDNAFKFTREGTIKFGYKVIENFVEFYVQDTGIGLDNNSFALIFDRFRQVELTSARQFGGTGLGLSISKAYVEEMGGKIWVDAKLGEGATFYFTLPLKIVKFDIQVNSTNDDLLYNMNWKDKTILIAEDERINYNFFIEILEETNVNVIWAVNGEEAIEKCLANKNIDLVLMDIKMPIINGYDATRAIKKVKPNLPIIAQTAYALVGDEKKAKQAGCDDYIHKPIDVDDLLIKLTKYLE